METVSVPRTVPASRAEGVCPTTVKAQVLAGTVVMGWPLLSSAPAWIMPDETMIPFVWLKMGRCLPGPVATTPGVVVLQLFTVSPLGVLGETNKVLPVYSRTLFVILQVTVPPSSRSRLCGVVQLNSTGQPVLVNFD